MLSKKFGYARQICRTYFLTPQNTEYTFPPGAHRPDYSTSYDFVDKRFDKPDIAPDPSSNEVLQMRDLGNKITHLRQAAIDTELNGLNRKRSSFRLFVDRLVGGFLGAAPQPSTESKTTQIKNELVERESLIGGQIFGQTKNGVTRRFFHDDNHQNQAWFFTETAPSNDSHLRYINEMRYEIHMDNNGILEVARMHDQSPQGYHYAWQYIDKQESTNLQQAAEKYSNLIVEKIYEPDYGLTD